jgi:hypothetical protein
LPLLKLVNQERTVKGSYIGTSSRPATCRYIELTGRVRLPVDRQMSPSPRSTLASTASKMAVRQGWSSDMSDPGAMTLADL